MNGKLISYTKIVIIFLLLSVALLSMLNFYADYLYERVENHLSDSALIQASMIQSVASFDSVYSTEDYGEGYREATLFQVDIAFQNIGTVDHKYDYLILDFSKESPYCLSTEYLYVEDNALKLMYKHFERYVAMLKEKEVGHALIRHDSKWILLDYRDLSAIDIGLITYTDISQLKKIEISARILLLILAVVLTVMSVLLSRYYKKNKHLSNTNISEIVNEKYKFQYHTIWSYDLPHNRFVIDDSILECLGYSETETIGTLEDYYNIVHADDLKNLKFKMNDLMFNKQNFLSVFYRMMGANGDAYIVYSEAVVFKRDSDDYPVLINGMNIILNDEHISWIGGAYGQ